VWRSGRVLECKSEDIGSRPGDVTFKTIHFCQRSSTFEKFCRKSSIFIVKFSSGMSETFFDTCVNWSCVTRCGCHTTSSTLFTVYSETIRSYLYFWGDFFDIFFVLYSALLHLPSLGFHCADGCWDQTQDRCN
jgi:hypothetical protein